jgi:hypothetical protein
LTALADGREMPRMRSAILLLVLATLGAACNNDRCASTYSGTWVGTMKTESVDFETNCDFVYTGAEGCTSVGDYSDPISEQGTITINVKHATTGCLAVGKYTCPYTASTSTFTYDCNNAGADIFDR